MRDSDYPVEEDEAFQSRTWRVQRVAWAVFTLIPLAALTGLFAHGYLSDANQGDARTLLVNYERFQRVTKTSHFTFLIGSEQPSELHLSTAFRRYYVIENIQPRPLRSTADSTGLSLIFDKPSGQPLSVGIWTKPEKFGWRSLVAQNGAANVTFQVLIYP